MSSTYNLVVFNNFQLIVKDVSIKKVVLENVLLTLLNNKFR